MSHEIDKMVEYNKAFVESKGYAPYEATAQPDRNMVILTCMDSRLTRLLPAALGVKNGDVKIVKTAGGILTGATDQVMRSLIVAIYAFGIENVMVIGHDDCGMGKVDNSYLLENMKKRGISEDTLRQLDTLNFNTLAWLKGFESVEESVRQSVRLVKGHPLVANDVCARGFVINPHTGLLREVDCG